MHYPQAIFMPKWFLASLQQNPGATQRRFRMFTTLAWNQNAGRILLLITLILGKIIMVQYLSRMKIYSAISVTGRNKYRKARIDVLFKILLAQRTPTWFRDFLFWYPQRHMLEMDYRNKNVTTTKYVLRVKFWIPILWVWRSCLLYIIFYKRTWNTEQYELMECLNTSVRSKFS